MELQCLRADAPKFEAIGFHIFSSISLSDNKLMLVCNDEDDGRSPVVEMREDEANYAHSVGVGWPDCRLPQVPFEGHHGSGGDYGSGLFATLGQRIAYAATVNGAAEPAVDVDAKTGKVRAAQLRAARAYLRTKAEVQALLLDHAKR